MMKQRVVKKVKENRGASIAIALLYFLICAVAGAVILAGASANISHISREKRDERNYLAVMSAAELLKEAVKESGMTWTGASVSQNHPAEPEERKAFKEEMGTVIDGVSLSGAKDAGLAMHLIKEVYQTYGNCLEEDGTAWIPEDGSADMTGTLVFTLETLSGFEEGMPEVRADYRISPTEVVMDGDYVQFRIRMTVDFFIAGDAPDQYRMHMDVSGLLHYSLDEKVETERFEWPDPISGETVVTYVNIYSYTSEAAFSPEVPVISAGNREVKP